MTITARATELFQKADQGQLSPDETTEWLELLDEIDFQAFCIERAQPHYMEGQIVDKQSDHVRVEWHDGVQEKIQVPICDPLIKLTVGGEFGAWVKLGRDERTLQIEALVPCPQEDAAIGHTDSGVQFDRTEGPSFNNNTL